LLLITARPAESKRPGAEINPLFQSSKIYENSLKEKENLIQNHAGNFV
jgi:hypothetical protein